MKLNDINWSEVPSIITKEQMRLICHCSKRTALYYLKSGKLPCEYSGKKTRCYKIRKEDLMVFLEDKEQNPEYYTVPENWYSCKNPSIRSSHSTLPNIKGEDLHEYFQYLLKEYPDVMETSMISEVTGYRVAVVNRWCSKGKLKHFVIKGRNLVPKIYLIDFLCSLDFRKISRKSDWHISSLQNYRRWKYLDSQQSK
jgi:hypothetical protein